MTTPANERTPSPAENMLREQMYTRPTLVVPVDTRKLQQNGAASFLGVTASPRKKDQGGGGRGGNWPEIGTTGNMLLAATKRPKKKSTMTLGKLKAKLLEHFQFNRTEVAVAESTSIRKQLAKLCLATGSELEACCHLVASHGACLRQQILLRHLKSKLRADIFKQPMVTNLEPDHLDINQNNAITNTKSLLSTLRELPTEWYVLQVTSEHEQLKDIRHCISTDEYMYSVRSTHDLHLVVLPTGKNVRDPICITLPKPNQNSTYDLRMEIESLLNGNKTNLTATYNNKDLYWKMRKKQNDQMSTAIWELEYSWLREWRILLQADYIEHLDLVQEIHNMIDKLIADSCISVSDRTRWLLKKIATGACHLRPFEVERAVKYILPTETKLAKNIILSIVAKTKVMDRLKTAKRKTLILILDEHLDCISFESMQLLKHQPVTRFPSLHILYALFYQHKGSIKNGYKIIRHSDKIGTFIVNPSLDLMHMEVRIRTFLNYWLPKWEGLYGIKPDVEFYKNALTSYDILMYNGHGSGIQFLKGEEIERMRVVALVMLFGCGSIRLLPMGGRQSCFGISNQYLMACSPCALGMLWEVTDGDIDRMTADFISKWIPSKAKQPWTAVNPVSWNKGTIEFSNNQNSQSKSKITTEQDMLIAVAKSKDVCRQYMTSAAIVLRGLPVKLVN